MNFTLKTLVAAVALVAASSANAYDNWASGNGSLIFLLIDSTTGQYMTKSLDKNVSDFVPTTTATPSSLNLSFNLNTSAAFATFSAANSDTSTWAWAVLAGDNTPVTPTGVTQNGGRRWLTTLGNEQASLNLQSTSFGALATGTYELGLSATVNEFLGNSTFLVMDGWSGRAAQGITNVYGAQSNFYYATGRTGTALTTTVKDTLGADAKWSFGAGNMLTFTTAAIPESDTYAMLLAGLGVMGMVARRRLAA